MATLVDMQPDFIRLSRVSAYQFYFVNGKDIIMLPIGAEYMVVYSPVRYTDNWHVVCFRVVLGPTGIPTIVQVEGGRLLEPDEIAHYEALIENG